MEIYAENKSRFITLSEWPAINVRTHDTKIFANSVLCTIAIPRPLSAQISPTAHTKLLSERT